MSANEAVYRQSPLSVCKESGGGKTKDCEESEPCLMDGSLASTSSSSPQSCAENRHIFPRRLKHANAVCHDDDTGGDTTATLTIERSSCCILISLILCLLAVSSLVAFLIGHWIGASEGRVGFNLDNVVDPLESDYGNDANHTVYPPILDVWMSVPKQRENTSDQPLFRLSSAVKPIYYEVLLNITDFQLTQKVHGRVVITVILGERVDLIVFHAAKTIDITSVEVLDQDRNPHDIQNVIRNLYHQTISVKMRKKLQPGLPIKVQVLYTARICSRPSGVYCERQPPSENNHPVSGTPTSDTQISSLVTKFEPALAKTIVPCFDEPQLKAVFNVTIVHRPKTVVLSNAPSIRSNFNPISRDVTTYFADTPLMSSYLLAIAAGSLSNIKRRTSRGLPINIWISKQLQPLERAKFAVKFAVHMLEQLVGEFTEEEFQINYPLKKLDFVASRNFPVGGMENWGLVVYHHNLLLLDNSKRPENSNVRDQSMLRQYKIEKIVTHELVHQWFGNLVTMDWWSELWLNEGFASFYVNRILRKSHPTLSLYEYIHQLDTVWQKQAALVKLPLVRNDLDTEQSVLRAFDRSHLYTKGAVMVHMMEVLIGQDQFRTASRSYLSENAYKSVNRNHLWRYYRWTSNYGEMRRPLGAVMESWLTNPGFPAIFIKRRSTNGQSSGGLSLSVNQSQADFHTNYEFLQSPKDEKKATNLTWTLPLHYQSSGGIERQLWFWNSSYDFVDANIGPGEWLLLNPMTQFPYRVNYDTIGWQLLVNQLKRNYTMVPMKARIQLILDANFFLKDTRQLPILLDMLSYLVNESELTVLLFGLKVVFQLIETYQATRLHPLLILFLRPMITTTQFVFDKTYTKSPTTAQQLEQSAVWDLVDGRKSQIDMLICLINSNGCRLEEGTSPLMVLADPSSYSNRQLAAVCHRLSLASADHDQELKTSILMLRTSLARFSGKWTNLMHLVACVNDESLQDMVAEHVFKSKSLGILTSLLASGYSLQYHPRLRLKIWRKLAELSTADRRRMFDKSIHLIRIVLHSIRSSAELAVAERCLSGHFNDRHFIRLKLRWTERTAVPQVQQWLLDHLQ